MSTLPPTSLPPCRWCGDVETITICETPTRGWHGRCLECGAQGPVAQTAEEAAELWRWARRPTPSLAAGPVERGLLGDLDAIQGVIDIASNGNLNAHEEEVLDAAKAVLADLRALPSPAAPGEKGKEEGK